MGLLASGTFPLQNICYLLFLDIVEWFSCDSTTHMEIWTRNRYVLANWISVISWKIPPLYVRDPQLWTGLGWNNGEFFLIRWHLRRTVPYQMGFTSENLFTNTAAVVLLWIWVHLFYKWYVQKGPVNWLRLLQFNIISDISMWKREKIGYNIALSQAEMWSK